MLLAVLLAWGCLLTVCASQSCPEGSDDASSWVRLKPLGHCRDGESTCLYRITLPPLTIQLPRPFRELEKMARELRSLALMVNQLKEDCQECKDRQSIVSRLRSADGLKDGERVQASRGTVNTKERQQDMERRVSDLIHSISEEKDLAFVSGEIKKNPVAVENQRLNASLERSIYPSPAGQSVETKKGSNGYDASHIEKEPDHTEEMRQVHSVIASEREKELQSLQVKSIESSLPGNRDKEQSPPHGRYTTYTIRARTGEVTTGTLTAQGKVESIPDISLVSVVTDDANDETKQLKNKERMETPMKRFPGFTRLTDSSRKEIKPNPNPGNRFKNTGSMRKVYSPAGNRTLKAAPRLSGLTTLRRNSYTEDHNTNRPERIRIALLERQPVIDTIHENTKEVGENMTRTLLDHQKDAKEKVKDAAVEGQKNFHTEQAGKPTVAEEDRPRVLQFPYSENKERNEKNDYRVIPTETLEFNQDTDTAVVSNPDGTEETDGRLKNMQSSNSNGGDATHRNSQTLGSEVLDSESLIHSGKDGKRIEKVVRLEGSKSTVSGWPDAKVDVSQKNPIDLDTFSENLFFSGTDVETDVEQDLSQDDRADKVSILKESRSVISANTDSTDDINHNKHHTSDINSKNPLKPGSKAESDTEVDTGLFKKAEKVSELKESRSLISDGLDGTDDVHSTNSSNLDDNNNPIKGLSNLKSDTTGKTGEEIRGSVPLWKDATRRDEQGNNKAASLRPVKQNPVTVDSSRVIKSPVRGVSKPGLTTFGQETRSILRPRGVLPLKNQEVNLHPANSSKISSEARELNQPNLRMVKNVTRINPNYMKQPVRANLSGIIQSKNPKQRRPYILQRTLGNGNVSVNIKIPEARDVENITDTIHHKTHMNNRRKQVHSRTGFFKKTENDMTQSIRPTVVMQETVDQVFGEKVQASPTVEAVKPLVNLQIENTSQKSKLVHPVESKSPGGKQDLDPITHGVKEHIVEAVMNQDTLNHDSNIVSLGDSRPDGVGKNKNSDMEQGRNPFTASNYKRLTKDDQNTEKTELTHPTTTATAFTIKNIIKDKQGHVDDAKTTSGMKVLDVNVHDRPPTSSQEGESEDLERSSVESQNEELKPTMQTRVTADESNQETKASPNSKEGVPNRERESNSFVMDSVKDRIVAKGSASPTDSMPDVNSENSKTFLKGGESLDNINVHNIGNFHPSSMDRARHRAKEAVDSAQNKERGSDPIFTERLKDDTLAKGSNPSTSSSLQSDVKHEKGKTLMSAELPDDINGDNHEKPFPVDRVKKTRDSAQDKEKDSNPIFMDRVNDSKLTKGSVPFTASTATSDVNHINGETPISADTLEDKNRDSNGNYYPVAVDRREPSVKDTIDRSQNREDGSNPFTMDRVKVSTVAEESAALPDSTLTPDFYPEHIKTPVLRSGFLENTNGDRNANSYPSAIDQIEGIKSMRIPDSYRDTTESSRKENDEKPITINSLKSRDDAENQLLTTCHGPCELAPTPQPVLNAQRSSDHNRDKPPEDCSDVFLKKTKNGVYSVTPRGPKNTTFSVFCGMETAGGGWTLIQHRFDGSVSFNRSWNEYKRGFGSLTGEFWLGNDKIHWLTATKAMMLRVELEDLDGLKAYAQYDQFHVASESQSYRLTVGRYSGTAGNALQYSKKFNHNQKYFTTPDRDNDQYPSGNCGTYYSSGWWFDACMAANLNGKYYQTRYKGVRNGIFWGAWHNISHEYYPTNDRQAFKTVRMMIKPRVVF